MTLTTEITSLLVANRGEIALRIMRTARAEGMHCIAVYTDADADAPHVAFADIAVNIGTGPVADSYLSIPRIIDAARSSGARAIHPGYGFLSENADFARAVLDAGLVFVGPSPDVIALMGNKAAAKRQMIDAGVPCVPGYEGEEQSDARMATEAARIGFPVMIKAAAGGGGRGMRLVTDEQAFQSSLTQARSESMAAFGSDEIILEKAVTGARHIEIQVFGDAHGAYVHLGERDCSLQRRHQKLIEEAPSPAVDADLRAKMGAAAVTAARSIGYCGAGTIEFLLDRDGAFYFLEMNTRLQVEHPVTELVTGHDLVALQLRVARGLPLDLEQDDITITGHAIEARLYAEDPGNGFLPATGTVEVWQPGQGDGVRLDSGIVEGQGVSHFYDPMLAKVVAQGPTREAARGRLNTALQDSVLFGVQTNRDFLIDLLEDPVFVAGAATTSYIDDGRSGGQTIENAPGFNDAALAAAVLYRHLQQDAARASLGVAGEMLGWSSAGALQARLKLSGYGQDWDLQLSETRERALAISDAAHSVTVTGNDTALRLDGKRIDLRATRHAQDRVHLALPRRSLCFTHMRTVAGADAGGTDGILTAPMHGNVQSVLVEPGTQVEPGTRLIVLEAMKMQHELRAEIAGTVTQISVAAGVQVRAGDLLLEIDAAEDA